MPVPDQVRDDGSGIQQAKSETDWITGQARNDKLVAHSVLPAVASSESPEFNFNNLFFYRPTG